MDFFIYSNVEMNCASNGIDLVEIGINLVTLLTKEGYFSILLCVCAAKQG